MKNKISKKEKLVIGITAGTLVALAVSILTIKLTTGTDKYTNIEVSESEIQQYKEIIGNSMDVKKSILILFDSYDECMEFIEEHGLKENPHEQGKGTIPYMPDGFYNIVGKSKLEEFFDAAIDGEYTKEPIEYSGMYCYLKRLGVNSIIEDEEELKKLIMEDKKQSRQNE
ncbi:MAG: hypothetical protein KIG65_01195 [Eubacteriales bacterium]|nr:hypothetical protein [Eubacteriales bacterium]